MSDAVSTIPSNDPARGPLIHLSDGFSDWLAAEDAALAFTTYQAGRLFFVGRRSTGDVVAHERFIENCQGLWTDGQRLWTSGLSALWRFENGLLPGETTTTGADRLFLPREARVTGDLQIHDVGLTRIEGADRPIFVNTLFSCLATTSDSASFRPLWRPRFISSLASEDRCHLNGLAMQGDRPAYVTAVAATDTSEGWRPHRRTGGIVIDVASGEIVVTGLSMPHSPRVFDGRLWVLNSGEGTLLAVDPRNGRTEVVAFCPGYARGLAFVGRRAVIGLSRPRGPETKATFAGLALDETLAARGLEARCGLLVIDIDAGAEVAWLSITHTIQELYDVAVLPGSRQAEAVGHRGHDIQRVIRIEH